MYNGVSFEMDKHNYGQRPLILEKQYSSSKGEEVEFDAHTPERDSYNARKRRIYQGQSDGSDSRIKRIVQTNFVTKLKARNKNKSESKINRKRFPLKNKSKSSRSKSPLKNKSRHSRSKSPSHAMNIQDENKSQLSNFKTNIYVKNRRFPSANYRS